MTEQQQYMTLPCALAGLRQHARVGVPVARTYTPLNIIPIVLLILYWPFNTSLQSPKVLCGSLGPLALVSNRGVKKSNKKQQPPLKG
jgi:hypothetical protein